jgi:hypothetical protein
MRWLPPNVSAQRSPEEGDLGANVAIRHTEIVVEQTKHTLEFHGVVQLHPGDLCPVCGQEYKCDSSNTSQTTTASGLPTNSGE